MRAKFIHENVQNFKRGLDSKKSLSLGSIGVRQQWWDDINSGDGQAIDTGYEIGNKLQNLLEEIGFENLDLSGVGPHAIGIDTDIGEFEFDWDSDGNVLIKGYKLGNLIHNPEEIAIRFKKDIYDKPDYNLYMYDKPNFNPDMY